jgi:hypothetical protein
LGFRTAMENWLPKCVKGVRKLGGRGVKKIIWAYFAGELKGTYTGIIVGEAGRTNIEAI